jgi:hypothetical protein
MKNLYFAILLLLSPFFVFSQHLYEIDLNKIEKDVLPVKMTLSKAPQTNQVTYSFPATVPGTYDTHGDIDVQLSNPLSDCSLDLSSSLGKVKVDRPELKKKSGSQLNIGNGKLKVIMETSLGSIKVR